MADPEKQREYMRQWRARNADKLREYERRRRAENPERQRENLRRWRAANPERQREISAEGYRRQMAANPEGYRETRRRWRAANPEKAREYTRQWEDANPEATRERAQRYREAHREELRDNARRLRALDRAAVFAHYGERCACCGSTARLTIDHIGGGGDRHRRELTGYRVGGGATYRWLIKQGFPDGYQTLCLPCNASKGEGASCRRDHRGKAKKEQSQHGAAAPVRPSGDAEG